MNIDCPLLFKGQTPSACKRKTALVLENTSPEAFCVFCLPKQSGKGA